MKTYTHPKGFKAVEIDENVYFIKLLDFWEDYKTTYKQLLAIGFIEDIEKDYISMDQITNEIKEYQIRLKERLRNTIYKLYINKQHI